MGQTFITGGRRCGKTFMQKVYTDVHNKTQAVYPHFYIDISYQFPWLNVGQRKKKALVIAIDNVIRSM